MTAYYLDSSVAVRILLGHSPEAAAWFDATTGSEDDHILASRLLRTELTRVLRREGLPVADRAQVLDYLDTVHLASAIRTGLDDLTVVTHDRALATAATQIGFRVHDPVATHP